jgi:hypothetical protein
VKKNNKKELLKIYVFIQGGRTIYIGISKGQLIWKCPFGVFKSTKKPTKNFGRISALASKKRGQIKKVL